MNKILFLLLATLFAGSLSADILVLESGKTLKIRSYTVHGAAMQIDLSDKAEMTIPVAWVREIRLSAPEPQPKQAAVAQKKPDFAYSNLVLALAEKHRLDWRLVAAVMAAESNFDPNAISPKGACGLMQLMPETARMYRVDDPYDPAQNIEAGIRHLKMLLERYDGNLKLVLAAYNSGEKTVDRYQGIPPYQETRDYVKRVLRRYKTGV